MTLNSIILYLKLVPSYNNTIISNILAHRRVVPNSYILNLKKFFNLDHVVDLKTYRDLFLSILICNYYIKNKIIFSNTDDLLRGYL